MRREFQPLPIAGLLARPEAKKGQKNRDAGDASLDPESGNIPLFHLNFVTLLFGALRQGEL